MEGNAEHGPALGHEDPRGIDRGLVDDLGVIACRLLPGMDEHLDRQHLLPGIGSSAEQRLVEEPGDRCRARLEPNPLPAAPRNSAHGLDAAGVAQAEEHGLVEDLADMGSHQLVELGLTGEPIVAEGVDDEGHLDGGERLGGDLPLPARESIRVRVLQEQSATADDDGIGTGVDALDERGVDFTSQGRRRGEVRLTTRTTAGPQHPECVPDHGEQCLVAVVSPGRDVEVEELQVRHCIRLWAASEHLVNFIGPGRQPRRNLPFA